MWITSVFSSLLCSFSFFLLLSSLAHTCSFEDSNLYEPLSFLLFTYHALFGLKNIKWMLSSSSRYWYILICRLAFCNNLKGFSLGELFLLLFSFWYEADGTLIIYNCIIDYFYFVSIAVCHGTDQPFFGGGKRVRYCENSVKYSAAVNFIAWIV